MHPTKGDLEPASLKLIHLAVDCSNKKIVNLKY
jgi:hypothetical protein